MFNVIHPDSGLKIDVIIAKPDSYDQSRLDRGVRLLIGDHCTAVFSSAEDIILQKMKWYRMGGGERHLRDISGVLKVRGDVLDLYYISQSAKVMDLEDLWQSIRDTST
jgi:hypothetical protein